MVKFVLNCIAWYIFLFWILPILALISMTVLSSIIEIIGI